MTAVQLAEPGKNMVPAPALLTDVLPSEHLSASGKPVPTLRPALRAIPNWWNAKAVVSLIAQALVVLIGAAWISHPVAWVVAFALMGRIHTMLGVLGHEAAHRLLFRNQRLNDIVGRWILSYPTFISFDGYRRGHFAHHRDEFGPKEPDYLLYANYPAERASIIRKGRRDVSGLSGYKILKALFGRIRVSANARQRVLRIYGTQLALLLVFTAVGRPEMYFLLWLLPWMTFTRTVGRLRAVAEHGGLKQSKDKRETTHHVVQSRLANFWMVPYNTGWHVAHHLDMGVPWRNLPELHRLMVADGYMTPDLEYPTYRALWKAMIKPLDETVSDS